MIEAIAVLVNEMMLAMQADSQAEANAIISAAINTIIGVLSQKGRECRVSNFYVKCLNNNWHGAKPTRVRLANGDLISYPLAVLWNWSGQNTPSVTTREELVETTINQFFMAMGNAMMRYDTPKEYKIVVEEVMPKLPKLSVGVRAWAELIVPKELKLKEINNNSNSNSNSNSSEGGFSAKDFA